MKLDRLLSITLTLLGRESVSASELASRHGVTVRTIYRDIDAINLAGIPVVSKQGNGGGFSVMPDYLLDRTMLSFEDMRAIVTALKSTAALFDKDSTAPTLERIGSIVSPKGKDALSKIDDMISIDISPWGGSDRERDNLPLVHKAIIDSRVLRFTYESVDGKRTERTAEPMTIIFRGFAWYCFAWCRLRNEYRVFRVSRMIGPSMSMECFERRDERYQEYIARAVKERAEVTIELTYGTGARSKVEDYFGVREHVSDGERCRASLTLPDEEWVYDTILSLGSDAEVTAPDSVRERIVRKIEKLRSVYQS
jgi:predicted DNA-binding transcriptional regulator YafY